MIYHLNTICKFLIVVAIITLSLDQVSYAQRSDPYGCRAKVRAELGLMPFEGPSHPAFWNKVDSCISRAQAGNERKVGRDGSKNGNVAKSRPNSGSRRNEAVAAKTTTRHDDTRPAPVLADVAAVSASGDAKTELAAEFGRRVALVIGNGQYEHAPVLPNATNDAEALATTLRATGFSRSH